MSESPNELNNDRPLKLAEQEVRKKRFQTLVEEYDQLGNEMDELIVEEGALIAKESGDEADLVRLQEINQREIEIVDKQKGIVEAIALLWSAWGQ